MCGSFDPLWQPQQNSRTAEQAGITGDAQFRAVPALM